MAENLKQLELLHKKEQTVQAFISKTYLSSIPSSVLNNDLKIFKDKNESLPPAEQIKVLIDQSYHSAFSFGVKPNLDKDYSNSAVQTLAMAEKIGEKMPEENQRMSLIDELEILIHAETTEMLALHEREKLQADFDSHRDNKNSLGADKYALIKLREDLGIIETTKISDLLT
jgi:hypothetical protein